jgi:hypothetical protein
MKGIEPSDIHLISVGYGWYVGRALSASVPDELTQVCLAGSNTRVLRAATKAEWADLLR